MNTKMKAHHSDYRVQGGNFMIPLILYTPPNGDMKDVHICGNAINGLVFERARKLHEDGYYFEVEHLFTGEISFTMGHEDHPYGDQDILILRPDRIDSDYIPTEFAHKLIMKESVYQRRQERLEAIEQEQAEAARNENT